VLVNDLAGDVDTARRAVTSAESSFTQSVSDPANSQIEETWTLLTLDVLRRLNALGGMRLCEKRWEGE
jgi:hypothetical protein